MALKWVNIRRKIDGKYETTVAETEPQIAALWSVSDHSPNITQGQDMGWRLAPEVAVEMKKIKQDLEMLERIARRFGKSLEDVGEIDILTYISNKTTLEQAPEPNGDDFQDEYDQEIRKLEGKVDDSNHNLFGDEESVPSPAALSTEELQAELARRQAAEQTTTTTTAAPTTTTTTTTKPVQ